MRMAQPITTSRFRLWTGQKLKKKNNPIKLGFALELRNVDRGQRFRINESNWFQGQVSSKEAPSRIKERHQISDVENKI